MCCLIRPSSCASGLAAKPRLAGSLDGSGYSAGIGFCSSVLGRQNATLDPACGQPADAVRLPERRGQEDRVAEIRTPHLMTLTLSVSGMQTIGATPNGNRRIGLVAGGT